MSSLKSLVAGNWKMFGHQDSIAEIDRLAAMLKAAPPACEVLICPPSTLVSAFATQAQGTDIMIGAQDCHPKDQGPHTGDISAAMLADCGASHVIVGHSERRTDHGESDALVKAKAESVINAGMTAIICVGETEEQRGSGQADTIVQNQLAGSIPDSATPATLIISYEPIWAIGTGRTPTVAAIEHMHATIRSWLSDRFGEKASQIRLLYGGSVKPSNASALMAAKNVNGALVGGASLKATDLNGIIDAYRR